MTPLRAQMIRELELHRKAPKTIEAYVSGVAQLGRFYGRSPDKISLEEIRDFLHHLITVQKVAYSTRNIKHRVLLMTTYGGGLRVSELVCLKPHDIHAEPMLMRVDQGKGRKDRYTLLSPRLLEELRAYWRAYRPQIWLFEGARAGCHLSVATAQKVFEQYTYPSCRNRHCPKCQSTDSAAWAAARQQELLPVPYFHNVFTLPHELNPLILYSERNQSALLRLLFDATAATLLSFGRSELGGQVGFSLVLHTWDQRLRAHYHVHCLQDGDRRKVDTLPAEEFLQRFLQHVLPDGFCRIHHYGLLANCVKRQRLALCRRLLGVHVSAVVEEPPHNAAEWMEALLGIDITQCPRCGARLKITRLSPLAASASPTCQPPAGGARPPWDTS